MITLNEYKILSNGKWLVIDAEVPTECQHTTEGTYDGTYISKIQLSNDGTYNDSTMYLALSDALERAGVEHDPITSTSTYITITDITVHSFRLLVDIDGLDCNPLFYLRLFATKTTATQNVCTSCAYYNPVEEITFYKYPLYKQIACAAHELCGCIPPKYFTDYLMTLKALEASIETKDADSINMYYDWLIKGNYPTSMASVNPPCGCKSH